MEPRCVVEEEMDKNPRLDALLPNLLKHTAAT